MTKEESIKILSVLKAAYPNSYRGMSKDEAVGTVNVWTAQFKTVPYFLVSLAVGKLIGSNTFPPAIKEVKDKIRDLYREASSLMQRHDRATVGIYITYEPDEVPTKIDEPLDAKTYAVVREILSTCERLKYTEFDTVEPLESLICDMDINMLPSASANLLTD